MMADRSTVPKDQWLFDSTISICISNRANNLMLIRILSDFGFIVTNFDHRLTTEKIPDLLIVDTVSLQYLSSQIQKIKVAAAPVLLPALLLSDGGHLPPNEPGFCCADVVRLPTTKAELLARISNLLQLSDVSRKQALEVSASELLLNSPDKEEDLIRSFCELMLQMRGVSAITGITFEPIADSQPINNKFDGSKYQISHFSIDDETYNDNIIEWERNAIVSLLDAGEQRVLSSKDKSAPWCSDLNLKEVKSVLLCPVIASSKSVVFLVFYLEIDSSQGDDVAVFLSRITRQLAASLGKLRLTLERQDHTKRIDLLANTDPLTNLPNRRALSKRLARLIAENEKPCAAVLFIDLNNFKLINDSLGHHVGDVLLQQVAERLKEALRQNDMLARQGGDEFIIIMAHDPRNLVRERLSLLKTLTNDAMNLALRITKLFEKPYQLGSQSHRVSACIGISLLCTPIDDPEVIIEQADMAMYHSKETDQLITFYSAEIEETRRRRLSMEAEVYRAFEQEQFRVHYQPIWSLSHSRIIGVEALLRWTDSTGRDVPPSEFIPIVESLKLMHKLGDFVIVTAARQLYEWRTDGLDLKMSVNLSVTQLQSLVDVDRIHKTIIKENTLAEWWIIELTEETIAKSSQKVEEALHILKQKGFTLALDDFGRGYSSLWRLQELPIDILKIDKSFIFKMTKGKEQVAFIKAIIEMARALFMDVIAEGIETNFQNDTLRNLNCDYGQGFLLGMPGPPDALRKLFSAEK